MSTSANLLLRVAVAFAFVFPALNAIGNPDEWLGYFPPFVVGIAQSIGMSDLVLLHAFGAMEAIIALWILWGRKGYIPAAAAAVVLALIVVLDSSQFTILFRDVSIALAAAALSIDFWRKERTAQPLSTL